MACYNGSALCRHKMGKARISPFFFIIHEIDGRRNRRNLQILSLFFVREGKILENKGRKQQFLHAFAENSTLCTRAAV